LFACFAKEGERGRKFTGARGQNSGDKKTAKAGKNLRKKTNVELHSREKGRGREEIQEDTMMCWFKESKRRNGQSGFAKSRKQNNAAKLGAQETHSKGGKDDSAAKPKTPKRRGRKKLKGLIFRFEEDRRLFGGFAREEETGLLTEEGISKGSNRVKAGKNTAFKTSLVSSAKCSLRKLRRKGSLEKKRSTLLKVKRQESRRGRYWERKILKEGGGVAQIYHDDFVGRPTDPRVG